MPIWRVNSSILFYIYGLYNENDWLKHEENSTHFFVCWKNWEFLSYATYVKEGCLKLILLLLLKLGIIRETKSRQPAVVVYTVHDFKVPDSIQFCLFFFFFANICTELLDCYIYATVLIVTISIQIRGVLVRGSKYCHY